MFISKNKKIKKRLLIVIVLFSVLFSNRFIYQKIVLKWQPKPVTLPKGNQYTAGILLGGFTNFDINKKGFFNEASDRFIETVKLYHQGIIQKIVMTGGSGQLFFNEVKESDFVKDELIANDIPEKDIIIENKSRNTYENAVFSKRILDSLQIKGPYVLITSATHLPRSIKVFNKAGMKVIPYPSDFHVINAKLSVQDYIIPELKLLNEWATVFHEIVGLAVYQLTGKA
jgi:uncharacterized SAM-binding protein YcdF (DUF218 family)